MFTEVIVKMKTGQEYSASTTNAKGDFNSTPLTVKEIEDKFRTNVEFSHTISKDKAEKALNLIENLEQVADVRELIKLLV
jgi:hypothetical protein